VRRERRPSATVMNDARSMDLVSDSLFNGRRFRVLTLVDDFSRECLLVHVDQGILGGDVAERLDQVAEERGAPRVIRVDNGPEFVSRALDLWAYQRGVKLDFSRPGKPTDNAMIESFNGSFRDECLNTNWFLSLDDARGKIEAWRSEYSDFRPHSSLGDLTPSAFARSGHGARSASTVPGTRSGGGSCALDTPIAAPRNRHGRDRARPRRSRRADRLLHRGRALTLALRLRFGRARPEARNALSEPLRPGRLARRADRGRSGEGARR
jgi:putative transposase